MEMKAWTKKKLVRRGQEVRQQKRNYSEEGRHARGFFYGAGSQEHHTSSACSHSLLGTVGVLKPGRSFRVSLESCQSKARYSIRWRPGQSPLHHRNQMSIEKKRQRRDVVFIFACPVQARDPTMLIEKSKFKHSVIQKKRPHSRVLMMWRGLGYWL